MQPLLDAVNALQAVPFKINVPVLDFVRRDGAPPEPEPPAELIDMGGPLWIDPLSPGKRWFARKQYSQSMATFTAWNVAMATAEALSGCDRFYVPLTIDFRGRLNPLCHFAFGREDFIRALFLFADGEPIGEGGLLHLKAYVAARADGNSWSRVKKPSELNPAARVQWTDENLELLRKIGRAVLCGDEPSTVAWALPKDDPYQFVAACAELEQALDLGPSFVTRLPLTFDGSCNGLQHMCKMTRAPEGRFVNLTEADDADDFYKRVAFKVFEALQLNLMTDMGGPLWVDGMPPRDAEAALKLLNGPFDRAIVKRPASTYFYGARAGGFDKKGKPHGMVEQVIEVLKEERKSTTGAMLLAHTIYRAVEGTVPTAKAMRDYLEAVAKLYGKKNKPVRWSTPLGLEVLNAYCRPLPPKKVRVTLNGRRRRMDLIVGDSPDLNRRQAVTRVTANFIHSCDAAHLQLVALAAAKEGIQMVSVHDCFGCLAPRAARFKAIIGERFDWLHEQRNMLISLRAVVARTTKNPPTFPEFGNAELSARASQHAFK
jgi:DNA-directed RNA polymerase